MLHNVPLLTKTILREKNRNGSKYEGQNFDCEDKKRRKTAAQELSTVGNLLQQSHQSPTANLLASDNITKEDDRNSSPYVSSCARRTFETSVNTNCKDGDTVPLTSSQFTRPFSSMASKLVPPSTSTEVVASASMTSRSLSPSMSHIVLHDFFLKSQQKFRAKKEMKELQNRALALEMKMEISDAVKEV